MESSHDTDSSIINWDCLGSDLTEMILSHLHISSIIRAACVCKSWRSIITTSSFATTVSATNNPWLFLYGYNNTYPEENQAFCFDPEAIEWIEIPSSICWLKDSFISSSNFLFNITPETFSFKPMLQGSWRQISNLRFSRRHALVGVYDDRFIVVGGVSCSDDSDHVKDILPVEIYNPDLDIWEVFPPLPAEFNPGNSFQGHCSASLNGKFYIHGSYSRFVSYFDYENRSWSEVQTIRPPGVMYSFLISCQDMLILAGLCNSRHGPSFNLWRIDEITMEFSELAIMPNEFLRHMFDNDDENNFTILKCVGLGKLIYVINEDHEINYRACVCEVNSQPSKCRWSKIPNLPLHINKFHKVVSFCSYVFP